jgi:hypothetical protein
MRTLVLDEDIQSAEAQLEGGLGLEHSEAKARVLGRLAK